MSKKKCIFWHRKDLRINDNIGLNKAIESSDFLTGLYIFDPKVFDPSIIAPAKIWFLLESLKGLQSSWEKSGSELLLIKGDPILEMPILIKMLNIRTVVWNKDVEPYSRQLDSIISKQLRKEGVEVIECWDQLLIDPGSLKTKTNTDYKVFGPFMKSWQDARFEKFENRIFFPRTPSNLEKVNTAEFQIKKNHKWLNLKLLKQVPDLKEFGMNFTGISLCPCQPGERAAQKQLEIFCEESFLKNDQLSNQAEAKRRICSYHEYRDFPSQAGTSFLSAALSVGTLSPRDAFFKAEQARLIASKEKSHQDLQSIKIWQQELIWREFYQHSLFNFPYIANGPFREKWKNFPWENNEKSYTLWEQGLTGFPIIDAAMRQLSSSGWMHNRCRMIVASFLVKDLICNWKIGEKIFMKYLVDGDLAANNGGWQWSASCGMDSKPLRIFNPHTQGRKFDPEAIYIKKWLPELSHVNTNDLLTGEIIPIERRGYPEPIINHKFQQAKFKKLYSQLKYYNK